jgi:hypothetical protein
MEKITIEQLEELYNDTLKRCGTYLLKEDDDTPIFPSPIGTTEIVNRDFNPCKAGGIDLCLISTR